MRLSTGMLASAAIAAISLGQAQAAISGLHSTGSDVVGGIDQAWTVDGGSAFAINNPAGVGWVGNTALSKWISNVPDTLGGPGPFTYSTTFSATAGPNAISGLMSADDQGAVYLNGNLVFTGSPDSTAPWSFLEPFSITSGFDVGLNVLTVLVPNNIETSRPDGLADRLRSGTRDMGDDGRRLPGAGLGWFPHGEGKSRRRLTQTPGIDGIGGRLMAAFACLNVIGPSPA